jgi:hypothetical protein
LLPIIRENSPTVFLITHLQSIADLSGGRRFLSLSPGHELRQDDALPKFLPS